MLRNSAVGPKHPLLLPIACQIKLCWRDHFDDCDNNGRWRSGGIKYFVCNQMIPKILWWQPLYVIWRLRFADQRLRRARLQTTPVFNMAAGNAAAYSQAARIADWISKQTQCILAARTCVAEGKRWISCLSTIYRRGLTANYKILSAPRDLLLPSRFVSISFLFPL